MEVKGKKIGIVGAAKSGLSAARVLAEKGAQVFLSDNQPLERLAAALKGARLPPEVEIETNGHSERLLENDFIVLSPGVPLTIPILRKAVELKIPILSEIEIAYRISAGKRFVITGSNGKTTTTTLLFEICEKAFPQVFLGGNIGIPMIEFAVKTDEKSIQILEVSSFQLETIIDFKPNIGVITNFYPNHLDRYPSYEAYIEAKERIFLNMGPGDWLVLNSDQPIMQEIAKKTASRVAWFGWSPPKCGKWLTHRDEAFYFREDGKDEVFLFSSNKVKIMGDHNLENIMAAIMVSILAEVSPEIMEKTVSEFRGVEHRLEWVSEISGIVFINDSKGTNCAATIIALKACKQPVILIAGGRDKGTDLLEWVNAVKERAKGVVLMGEAQNRFRAALEGIVPLKIAKTFEEAVHIAFDLADPGDAVLLSPSCSSYDMFPNFEVRGKVFKDLVKELSRKKK